MQLTQERIDDIVIITIDEGRLDYKNVNAFQSGVLDIIEQGHSKLAFDMRHVAFMDSRGLSAFLSILRALGKTGRIALFDVHDTLNKVFKLTHTDRLFLQKENRADALQGLKG